MNAYSIAGQDYDECCKIAHMPEDSAAVRTNRIHLAMAFVRGIRNNDGHFYEFMKRRAVSYTHDLFKAEDAACSFIRDMLTKKVQAYIGYIPADLDFDNPKDRYQSIIRCRILIFYKRHCRNFVRDENALKRGCPVSINDIVERRGGLEVTMPGGRRAYELPLDILMRSELSDELRNVVSTLSSSDQEILHLKYVQGLSHKKIGIELGTSPGAVHSKLYRVRKKLHQKLGRVI